jgi:hypothetical protein
MNRLSSIENRVNNLEAKFSSELGKSLVKSKEIKENIDILVPEVKPLHDFTLDYKALKNKVDEL